MGIHGSVAFVTFLSHTPSGVMGNAQTTPRPTAPALGLALITEGSILQGGPFSKLRSEMGPS